MNVSTVKVCDAINAALGELEAGKQTSRLGIGSVSKKQMYGVTESVSTKYVGTCTIPLRFDAWHCAVEKAEKIASTDTVVIPEVFHEWLTKMIRTEATPAPAVEVKA